MLVLSCTVINYMDWYWIIKQVEKYYCKEKFHFGGLASLHGWFFKLRGFGSLKATGKIHVHNTLDFFFEFFATSAFESSY